MIVEILSIGTEILLGNIVNTNAQYLSKKMASLGMDVYYQSVVGDNSERIKSALDIAFSRSDIVITTGGLGPTKDDMSKEVLMSYFGNASILDEKAYSMLLERMKKLNVEEMSESIKKQAYVPEGSIVMYNHFGSAPGCILEKEDKVCIILPGPPFEMKPMFETYAEPYLMQKSNMTLVSYIVQLLDFDKAPVSKVGEALVAERLAELLDSEDPTVATYTNRNSCKLRISAKAKNKEEAKEKIRIMINKCVERIGKEYIDFIKEDDENTF